MNNRSLLCGILVASLSACGGNIGSSNGGNAGDGGRGGASSGNGGANANAGTGGTSASGTGGTSSGVAGAGATSAGGRGGASSGVAGAGGTSAGGRGGASGSGAGAGGTSAGGRGGTSAGGRGGASGAGAGAGGTSAGGRGGAGAGAGGTSAGGRGGTGASGGSVAPPSACGSTTFQPPTGGKAFYVAPTGVDTAAGTMTAPFRTMKQAARSAKAGDVVYLRDGVFSQAEDFTATGAAGNPVVFMAQPGEHPIIDGGSLTLGRSDSLLQLYQAKHVVVAGIEFRNSDGRGIQLIDADDVVIRDCIVHDVAFKAIGLNGNNLVAQGNVVYNAVLDNKNSGASGGWSPGITTQVLENGSASTNVVVRGNVIHDVWGECIDALFVNGMTIAGNDVRDCWSVGIYVDTARAVRIEGNIVRASNQAFMRNGHLMDGILLGAEEYDGTPDFGAEDVVIANNIVLGTHNGIGWWDSGSSKASNTYKNTQIVSNVVWGSQQNAIMFDTVPSGRTAPTGTLVNNILYGSATASLRFGNATAWTITANDFPNGKPSTASDASNLAVDAQLTGTAAATADATAFRLGASSALRHAGRAVAAVPLDFACATRGTTDTTIGAFE